MTRVTLGIAAALALAAVVPAAPASAAGSLTRTFVSSTGVDSNPCTVTQPCATFAAAYNAVAANGIVAALDPGKYGPLTITGPVTINGNGWAAVTAPAQNNGFTINAVSGNITLTGLEIDGAQAAYNGIVFNSGSSLTVTDCAVQNMVEDQGGDQNTGNGILLAPTSGTIDIAITNTTVANNGNSGLYYLPPSGSPTVNGIFDRITATTNYIGIFIDSQYASGGTTSFSLTNSIASNNSYTGIYAYSGSAAMGVLIDNVNASSNGYGIYAGNTAKIVVGHSVVANNSNYGIYNQTGPSTFYTYQNNEIYLNGNSNAVGGSPPTSVTYQ
jgi:hypothetical protein